MRPPRPTNPATAAVTPGSPPQPPGQKTHRVAGPHLTFIRRGKGLVRSAVSQQANAIARTGSREMAVAGLRRATLWIGSGLACAADNLIGAWDAKGAAPSSCLAWPLRSAVRRLTAAPARPSCPAAMTAPHRHRREGISHDHNWGVRMIVDTSANLSRLGPIETVVPSNATLGSDFALVEFTRTASTVIAWLNQTPAGPPTVVAQHLGSLGQPLGTITTVRRLVDPSELADAGLGRLQLSAAGDQADLSWQGLDQAEVVAITSALKIRRASTVVALPGARSTYSHAMVINPSARTLVVLSSSGSRSANQIYAHIIPIPHRSRPQSRRSDSVATQPSHWDPSADAGRLTDQRLLRRSFGFRRNCAAYLTTR